MQTETNKTTTAPGVRPVVGVRSKTVKTVEVNPYERIPTFRAGGEDDLEKGIYGLVKGSELAGRFIEARLIKNAKLMNGQAMLYILRDESGQLFGIWGVGNLKCLQSARRGLYLVITYNGKGPQQTKRGLADAHLFTIETEGGELLQNVISEEVEDHEASAANA